MAPRIVAGLFQSEGTAEDACYRLKTEGVPAADIGRKVLKKIGRPPRDDGTRARSRVSWPAHPREFS